MPTRWNGSNFSPTLAPWEFFDCQFLRRDFFANAAMFFSASATAARNDSSALIEAASNSACVTAELLGGKFCAVEFFRHGKI